MSNRCAVILAAGDGKRMKSTTPKVLCNVLFEPMISWVLSACEESGIQNICTVVGAGAQEVLSLLPRNAEHAFQNQRMGTGHAVKCAADFISHQGGDVLILYGDAPFVTPQVIDQAYALHKEKSCDATVITARVPDPKGYGRIVRSGGNFCSIVEERDADEGTKKIDEINSGIYWFKAESLLSSLEKITCENAAGEYYLTDTLGIIMAEGGVCEAYCSKDPQVVEGANDRKGLAYLNRLARERRLLQLFEDGVDIPLDDGIIIGRRASIGPGTTILPGTVIKGSTMIGPNCTIGPNSFLEDAVVGEGCNVKATYITDSVLGDNVSIGPFTHVRPGSKIGAGCKIGNFNEIKNATLGTDTKMAHLSYCGDADVGSRVNFGCGTVVVNYDGVKKHRTTIGDDAFIGCNTNLVAPVSVGSGAYTAAGTTVTQNVPDDALSIGRCKDTVKEGYAAKLREKLKQ